MDKQALRSEMNALRKEYSSLRGDLGHYNKQHALAKKLGMPINIEWYSELRRLTMSQMNRVRAQLKKVMGQLCEALYGVKHPSLRSRPVVQQVSASVQRYKRPGERVPAAFPFPL